MTEEANSSVSKIEREMKLTRTLILLCTAATLGIMLLNITIMINQLPGLMFAEFTTNLDKTYAQWTLLNKVNCRDKAACKDSEVKTAN